METLISLLALMLATALFATAQTEDNIASVSDRDGNLVYWLNGTSL